MNHMKSILLALLVLTLSPWANAQSVRVSYQDTHIGRNVSAVSLWGERHQFYGGIKFHLNWMIHDNQSNTFHKRFYASNLGEHLGIQGGYQWRIPLSAHSAILPFYDCQFTVAGTKGKDLVPTINPAFPYTGHDGPYTYAVIYFDQIKALEQYVGIAVEADLWQGLFVDVRLGAGVALYWDIPSQVAPNQFYVGPSTNWEMAGMASFGVGYRWGRAKP